MATNTYNGWTNYETWNVKLWMDNDEGSYRHWAGMAQSAYDDAVEPSINARLTGREPFTRKERAALALAEILKSEYEEAMPETTGVWSDLLGAALSEVNWHEIATALLEEHISESESEEQDD